MNDIKKISQISKQIEMLLQISIADDCNIYIGPSNIAHMKSRHPNDFEKYGNYLPDILNSPDYVGMNPNDGSIEYVKEFCINNEYVKVAVRASGKEKYFARTLYTLNARKTNNYIKDNRLKKI